MSQNGNPNVSPAPSRHEHEYEHEHDNSNRVGIATPNLNGPSNDDLEGGSNNISSNPNNTGSSSSSGENGLKRDITTRQMILMAAGGSIGAGLFVGSGQALSAGGPGSLVVNFAISGLMVGCTMASLGEMATSYPTAGAFYDYAVRFIGTPIGFAVGWNFVLNWLVVLPFELVTIGAQLQYWNSGVQPYVFVGPFLIFLCAVAFMGVRWFAELEHWLGLCKAAAISSFICFAVALTTTGIPGGGDGDPLTAAAGEGGALGARYWTEKPAFKNGFQGFLAVFRIAGMAYGGTELLGLTAAECRRPHRIMPVATKVVFFRLVVFYVGALLMLGFVVPADSELLASVGHGPKTSPFVLAARTAGVPGLAHFFNAMIVAALLAMANTSAFASSRALQAICARGMGPPVLARLRWGIPVPALVVAFSLALLALVTAAPAGEALFDWLLSLSGISNYMTWAAICYSHVRMRAAMRAQGRSPRDLIWRSPFGVAGSYLGMAVCLVALGALILNALWPLGGVYSAVAIVRDLLGFGFATVLFVGYLVYRQVRRARRREASEEKRKSENKNKSKSSSSSRGGDGDGESSEDLDPLLIPLARIDLATGFRDRESAAAADRECEDKRDKKLAKKLAELGWDEQWPWPRKVACHLQAAVGWPWVWRKRT